MFAKLMSHYCRLLTALSVISLAVMVVLVFGNVVMRYGFNSGLTLSEELSRWLFVWMPFMGAIVALNERTHLCAGCFSRVLGTKRLSILIPSAPSWKCRWRSFMPVAHFAQSHAR